jgi:hypothetical protein
MIDRENVSFRWLLVGVLTVTIVFNGIALALNPTFSADADTQSAATSATATERQLATVTTPS